jgi:16S rRNA (cytosine1402-N4)-methyltransferase
VVAETPQAELADIIYRYGEERRSRAIAAAIARERAERPLVTTGDLARLVANVFGGRKVDGRHPATRTFQALRIFVNDELGELERGLAAAEQLLRPGGRLCVVTFHSLEDRIVKQFIAARAKPPAGNRRLPVAQDFTPTLREVGGAIRAGDAETDANPRARSAVLRVAEKLS